MTCSIYVQSIAKAFEIFLEYPSMIDGLGGTPISGNPHRALFQDVDICGLSNENMQYMEVPENRASPEWSTLNRNQQLRLESYDDMATARDPPMIYPPVIKHGNGKWTMYQ